VPGEVPRRGDGVPRRSRSGKQQRLGRFFQQPAIDQRLGDLDGVERRAQNLAGVITRPSVPLAGSPGQTCAPRPCERP
jgi:hypothetical protein